MKNFLLAVCIVLLAFTVSAQDVRFGLKAGVNLSSASGTESEANALTSFHVGGMMEALYSEKFALQPEIVFSFQGFETETDNVKETFKFTYINIPVMFKYFPTNGMFLEAGPQIGYLNTAKLERQSSDGSEKIDIKDAMRDNDLSLNLGAGFQTKSGLSISARYCLGLTNLVRRELDRNFKNNVIQVSLGYLF